ncbi:aldolase/citrate lyase family protein [Nocardia sp. NPDC004260]
MKSVMRWPFWLHRLPTTSPALCYLSTAACTTSPTSMTVNDPAGAPPRSYLFVPASNERLLSSARTVAADMIIIDLEDSVPSYEEEKRIARQRAISAITSGDWSTRRLSVRVNAWESPWLLRVVP